MTGTRLARTLAGLKHAYPLIGIVCMLAWPDSRAYAFTDAKMFFAAVSEGGTAGRWFTGSPADGYSCDVCHEGAPAWPLSVQGLPEKGYVTGSPSTKPYDVRISWDAFRAREIALIQANPNMADPVMGLVAEFVAEDGTGAGTVEVGAFERTTPNEQCSRPLGGNAVDLWTVAGPMATPTKIRQTCTMTGPNQRCIVDVKGCGAGEVRLKWLPPPDWHGAIWFNAAFVATDESSGLPADSDAVSSISVAMMPGASSSASYISQLEGDCTVRRGASGGVALACWSLCLLALQLRRSARRPRAKR
jgi:hypothetical protein